MPIFHLDTGDGAPIYLRLKDAILERIRTGVLRPGDRLPPTRRLAGDLGLNRGTVAAAYDELVEEGVLTSHVGRGTFVSDPLPAGLVTPVTGDVAGPRWADHFAGQEPPPRNVFPTLPEDPAAGDFPVGFHRNVPDPALFPDATFRQSLDEAMRDEGASLLGYAPAEGHPAFVEFLLEYLRDAKQLNVPREQVLVVNGSQQALDLIARAFLRPGDTVLVEEPSYSGALELFRAFGARIVGAPMDEEGLRVDEAEALVARERPKLVYVMPTFQNPSGHSLSAERRETLVRLAARFEVPLIEDDFDSELYYDGPPPPPLKSLPGARTVLYIGTPSKMLFPGLRIGWLVAPGPVVERLGRIKQIGDLSSSPLLQSAFARFARSGALADHTDMVRRAYGERRGVLLEALERHMPAGVTWTRPRGGMSLLVTLPEGSDAGNVLRAASREGVLFAPGTWFFPSGGERHLRICFGAVPTARVAEGIERLARAVRAETQRADGGRRRPQEAALPPV